MDPNAVWCGVDVVRIREFTLLSNGYSIGQGVLIQTPSGNTCANSERPVYVPS